MPIPVTCPHCALHAHAPDAAVGHNVTCPECKTRFVVFERKDSNLSKLGLPPKSIRKNHQASTNPVVRSHATSASQNTASTVDSLQLPSAFARWNGIIISAGVATSVFVVGVAAILVFSSLFNTSKPNEIPLANRTQGSNGDLDHRLIPIVNQQPVQRRQSKPEPKPVLQTQPKLIQKPQPKPIQKPQPKPMQKPQPIQEPIQILIPETKPSPESVAVIRYLATELSFSHYSGKLLEKGEMIPSSQRLFIPFACRYLHNSQLYQQQAISLLKMFSELMKVENQDLRKVVEESRRIFFLRVNLVLLNECYGLTPSSSIGITGGAMLNSAWRNALQPNDVMKDFADAHQTAQAIITNTGKGAKFSAVMKYADMDAADRSVKLWQKSLLPWTKRIAGPNVDDKLLSIQPQWLTDDQLKSMEASGLAIDYPDQKLDHLTITNVSGKDLNDLVVEALVENEWKEKSGNYYYCRILKAGAARQLVLHPRWAGRRSVYSRNITLNYSVWAAESSNVGRTMTLKNPKPNPYAGNLRKRYLEDESEYGKIGSALVKIRE